MVAERVWRLIVSWGRLVQALSEETAFQLREWLEARAAAMRDYTENSPPLWPRILILAVPTALLWALAMGWWLLW